MLRPHRTRAAAAFGRLAYAALLLATVREASAQEPAPPEPALSPPRLLTPAELALPEGVTAPVTPIDVLLTIDTSGQVTEAAVEHSHGEAIDAAVLAAARGLRFEPARRGAQAIAARVRFRFELARAEATPAPSDAATTDTAASGVVAPVPPESSAAASRAEPIEMLGESHGVPGATARVDRPRPGAATRVKLRGRELTMVPGTFGEPLRVVATLPGVARSPYGLGFFLVRGASFQNTGFLVDGFQVPLLYHLGAGPAILSSRLVEQLDFYPGGYPVAYGRFTAGVIALRTAPPPAERVQIELELDLLRASGLAIVPFGQARADGSRAGSVAVAFRRSYYELFLPLITDDVSLSYTDYQLRVDYGFTPVLRASLLFFGSRDALELQQATGAGATTGTAAGGLHYSFDQLIGTLVLEPVRALSLRWSGTIGPSGFELSQQSTGDPSLSTDTSALRLGQRFELTYAPSELSETTLGFEESIFIYDVRGSIPAFGELPAIPAPEFIGESVPFADRLSELSAAPYLEQVVRPWRFELTFGARAEYLRYGNTDAWAVDPRGVVRFALTDEAKLKAATGLFAQPPLPFQIAREAANPLLRPSRALQSSFGTEIKLPAALEIDSTVFYSLMWQITRPTPEVRVSEDRETFRPFFTDDGRGRAYGLELLLRRRAEQGLFGWLSYTLSRSERFLEGGKTVVFAFDQTHVLNLAASYAVSGWTFGARFTLATGRPVADLLDPEGDDAVYDADQDDYEGDSRGRRVRLPAFHQLDVRIDRDWTLGPVHGSVFLDVINVYNARNSESYQYQYDFKRRDTLPSLPILPTIGVRGVL